MRLSVERLLLEPGRLADVLVLEEGRVTGIDLAALEAEMIKQLRHGMHEFNDWQRTVVRMRAALTRFYATGMHCS